MEFIEKIREGYAAFGAYQTWYRVTGDLSTGRTPLVIIHGGPGCTHDYVDNFKDLETLADYPPAVAKFLRRVSRVRIERLLYRIL